MQKNKGVIGGMSSWPREVADGAQPHAHVARTVACLAQW
jgi:hypothetical protein